MLNDSAAHCIRVRLRAVVDLLLIGWVEVVAATIAGIHFFADLFLESIRSAALLG